uniref:Uncharacterized protein n=1 Tax=Coccidioides posadasii RMSCC 3488 TaxID=454284 RepID=A0A0J6EVR5_COCPO|nr:hypothetical protein CPAG_00983 [Coccidioides posadasii RMSCC 3488]
MDIEPASAPLPSRDIYSQMNGCLQAPDCSRCMDFNIEQGQIGILNIKVNIQDPGIATRYFVGFPHPTKSVQFILCGITGMANTDVSTYIFSLRFEKYTMLGAEFKNT